MAVSVPLVFDGSFEHSGLTMLLFET